MWANTVWGLLSVAMWFLGMRIGMISKIPGEWAIRFDLLTAVFFVVAAVVGIWPLMGQRRTEREQKVGRSWLKLSREIMAFSAEVRVADRVGQRLGPGDDGNRSTVDLLNRMSQNRANYLHRFSVRVREARRQMEARGLMKNGAGLEEHGTNLFSYEGNGTIIGEVAHQYLRALGINPDELV
jgi:hypothetical protein